MAKWKRQPWMGPSSLERRRWDTHEEAMSIIRNAGTVVTLSYEEAVLIYSRARGFIVDDAAMMGSPLAPTQEVLPC